MRVTSFAAALTLFIAPAALAEEIPGTAFEAGNWYGAGYSDDTGAFSYCSVEVQYMSGEVLWMGLYPDDTLAVLLSRPDVRFRPGETFDSWLMLEYGLPTRGVSEAWDENYAGMTLDGIDASIAFLTQGVWLRLLGIGIDEAYDVTGITEALAAANACYLRNSGSNPFADASQPPLGTAPDPTPDPMPDPVIDAGLPVEDPPVLGATPPMPKVPDLRPKTGTVDTGGGLGTRPGGALGTPAPKPTP
ncbi:MAG: hypothetical protein B7Z10_10775 [Rhodobacterales bacterium 32-66-7]|nr:MAG: hypothetical protein B7Z31_04425 [Rhodobacterales bacterium 12-65-15]OYX23622.1 MAG: hypothetical protein B7Z10_10775 [Rhodobacterales bacterium 32-66-7]